MKYIRIKNNGLIEPQALHLVGASTKRNDSSKIGQFGSGNKYAMAFLLRNNYGLKVFSGLNEITIDTKPETFRNETFNIVFINGEKTSITTEMGKDWKFWQAIREVYCNALDESGASIDFVQDICPTDNETHFYIDNKGDVMDFMSNFNNYFSVNKKVLFDCEYGQILEKTGEHANLYRKGIRCFNTTKFSCFDYNLNDISINEDRLVQYFWQIEEKIWRLIYSCTNTEVIRTILCNSANSEFIEGSISDISSMTPTHISDEFKSVLSDIKVAPKGMGGLLSAEEQASTILIPSKIFEGVRGVLSDDNVSQKFKIASSGAMFRKITQTLLHDETLRKANDFLNEVGLEIPYTINVCVFDDKNVLGCAHKGEIYLSDVCMEKGVAEVVNTIIEEYIHIKYDCQDETRKMQTAIITEFISYMQKVNSYAI
jgi:hypothetical protein